MSILGWTAASVAFVHTVIGVDHVLPFIMLARSERWSFRRTMAITGLCGVGHVASSALLGGLGLLLGAAVEDLAPIQELRGRLAVYGLVGFGLAYAAVATYRLLRGQRRHAHLHLHHVHHGHEHGHGHEHDHGKMTPLLMFAVFVLGPCEALIPLMMAPAITHDWAGIIGIVTLFSGVTIATMMSLVALGYAGLGLRPLPRLEPYLHVTTGLMIAASGAAISILGI